MLFKHILSSADISPDQFERLYQRALEIRAVRNLGGSLPQVLKGVRNGKVAFVFTQESTRTRASFEASVDALGGDKFVSADALRTSAMGKSESLADTVESLAAYDYRIFILRSEHEGDAAYVAQRVAGVHVINAGDGPGEHPTQALLDLAIFRKHLRTFEGRTIAFVGDLKYSRTVRSLVRLLARLHKPAKLMFISVPELMVSEDLVGEAVRAGIQVERHEHIDKAIEDADALYLQRLQLNNWPIDIKTSLLAVANHGHLNERFGINAAAIERSRNPHMIFHHPGPRTSELSDDAFYHPRCIMREGMQMGYDIRTAILETFAR